MAYITYEDIRKNDEIRTYIRQADQTLTAMGFTEHSYAHVTRTAETAGALLKALGYPEREVELARIAGYMHDIGNVVNRKDHAHTGAVMAFRILDKLGMPPAEVAAVIAAIGNHDESDGHPISAISSALILADKSDVRRSRVRGSNTLEFDIHDRVNYAVQDAQLVTRPEENALVLQMNIDTTICPVMDYFEIFLGRMLLCRKAAEFFSLRFKLEINGQMLL